MNLGPHYESNSSKIASLTDDDWRVAIKRCDEHVKLRLRQRTLYGAHSPARLGGDPVAYYVGIAIDKVLMGDWEWKDKFTISEQLIRIADSHISTEVEKSTGKNDARAKICYTDDIEFYQISDQAPEEFASGPEVEFERRLDLVERACQDDAQLEEFLECIKTGYKRAEIAEVMGLSPKQVDKLKERLVDRTHKLSNTQR